MKDFKGTKGNWYVRDMSDGDCFVEAKELKNHIGKIEIMMDDAGEHNGYPLEQKRADAQLIASAPELLEALLKVKELSDGGHIFLGALPNQQVNNAIKKALGK